MIDYRELLKDINIDIYADGADLNVQDHYLEQRIWLN